MTVKKTIKNYLSEESIYNQLDDLSNIKEIKKNDIDCILGVIDEEVAILKDDIEKQNRKIKKINTKLNELEDSISKK